MDCKDRNGSVSNSIHDVALCVSELAEAMTKLTEAVADPRSQ